MGTAPAFDRAFLSLCFLMSTVEPTPEGTAGPKRVLQGRMELMQHLLQLWPMPLLLLPTQKSR